MAKRESASLTVILCICLVFISLCPLLAEDKVNMNTGSDLILVHPSLSFSLQQIVAKTPLWFEIQPFVKDAFTMTNADIQHPLSIKPNRFERTAYNTSLITLTALSLADVVTTIQALKYDGLTEGNPVMKPLVNNVYLFTAVKLGVTALNYYLLKKLHKKNKPLAWVLSITANLVMSWVVANNIHMIRDARAR
jgi:hypothetical protein